MFIKKQLDSAILIGHSFGGAIVQLFLEQFPEKVEKMVLISSIPPTGMLFDMGHFALRHPWKFLKLGTINFRKNIHSINDVGSLFLSNKISLTKRKEYCEKIQKDSIRTNITTLKPIVSKNFNPSVSVLTRSAIRKTAEFYHGKIVMFDDLTHDMMLDPEWKKVAIVIENFLR